MDDLIRLDAVRGPWTAVLARDGGTLFDIADLGPHDRVKISVVRRSAAPVDGYAPGSYATEDVLYSCDDFDNDDEVAVRWVQAQRVAELLNADDSPPWHLIEFRGDGWTIQHPLACKPDLFACRYNRLTSSMGPPPIGFGVYRCDVDDDGRLKVGDRHDPAAVPAGPSW